MTRDVASAFDILPAIDLVGGRVVRLERGDFDRATSFSDDPVATAIAFADAGARWLHVVDLDGARAGEPRHGEVIRRVVGAVGKRVSVEVAGGLRSPEAIATVLGAGAARVVIGTAALRVPGFAAAMVGEHGVDRVAVAVDVRDGLAIGDAWASSSAGAVPDAVIEHLAADGVRLFEVTAIDRDGLLGGPDLDLYERLVRLGMGAIVASAGIASTEDIAAVRALGCTGAIIGRALYDGRLSLEGALRA